MSITYDHPDWERSVVWEYDPGGGWEAYHEELDSIVAHAEETKTPFFLIFLPGGDVPKGNPMTHMRRLVQFSKSKGQIIHTIIVMGTTWIVARAFVKTLNRFLSLEPEVKIVFSMEEARQVYSEARNKSVSVDV